MQALLKHLVVIISNHWLFIIKSTILESWLHPRNFEEAAPREEQFQATGQRPVPCQWQKGDE